MARMQDTAAHAPAIDSASIVERTRPTGSPARADVAAPAALCSCITAGSGATDRLLVLRDDAGGRAAGALDERFLEAGGARAHLLQHRRRHFEQLHAALDQALAAGRVGFDTDLPEIRLQLRGDLDDR